MGKVGVRSGVRTRRETAGSPLIPLSGQLISVAEEDMVLFP